MYAAMIMIIMAMLIAIMVLRQEPADSVFCA